MSDGDKNDLLSAEDFGLTNLEDGENENSMSVEGNNDVNPDDPLQSLGDLTGEKENSSPTSTNQNGDVKSIDMILDVPLVVTVELGRTKMLVNDLLQLGQGSVIELDKMAGEPMEILVNDKLVALGEVVVGCYS